MEFLWHTSDWGHSRILETKPPHELGDWVVFHHPGTGDGLVEVARGASAVPPPEIAAMLRVKGLWRVIADPKGYFIVTILEDRIKHWTQLEALVIQAIVEARKKIDGAG